MGCLKKINFKAQSTLEYAILIMVVAAAFVTMYTYVVRGVNSRLHDIELEASPTIIINSTTSP